MQAATQTLPGARLIHLIDREGDSVWALPALGPSPADLPGPGRCRASRGYVGRAKNLPVGEVARRLAALGAFVPSREVEFHGQRVQQEVAETVVVLTLAGLGGIGGGGGQKISAPLDRGSALARLRLIVSRLRGSAGPSAGPVAGLLSNAPIEVSAATLALWYYWRWRY